ncbi:GHKL domain-containing protein [Anaerobacillus sp. CMMVII]|uniref:sensor histidine kinase n=1 Tax=Anaerobacillus sp. CMMVII TaxID=2755588 RepID=UPI0021B7957F|nr:HAMP domain-containing sensor histidine kinase [Anaerobacillus sp. CMMVII]MCT8138244.1 GHKL domain-containing protein [Anaerobacillus sp. CMMVII]
MFSHDMRSPLTSINGFVGAMLDGTIPENDQKRYLHLMKDETERLIKLVNDLLDIARIEAGQVSIHPRNYNVSEQIRKLIAKLEPQLSKQKIDIEIQSNEEDDLYIFADRDRIDQVLGNLIENAINFSNNKGLVVITLSKIEKEVQISIADHGPGIPKKELKFIWDRFFKVDKARSQKVGTGIGLSIVKHIIDLHGAKIEVQSELGKGTVFSISLPTATNNTKNGGLNV